MTILNKLNQYDKVDIVYSKQLFETLFLLFWHFFPSPLETSGMVKLCHELVLQFALLKNVQT